MTRYRTIVADPPWRYTDPFGCFPTGAAESSRRHLPYGALSVREIIAIPIGRFVSEDGANIFLWTTNRYLHDAFHVLEGWGASYSQTLVWHKTGANPITGSIAPTACEYLLYARFGSPGLSGRLPDSLVETKRPGPGQHSRKPDVFLDLIESVSPGPYVELFARRARFGWDYWGNESLGTAEMAS